MPDKLTEMFQTWLQAHGVGEPPTMFQAFQGGVSASAFSTRIRAIAVVQKTKMDNDVKNALLTAIGTLSDIPE